jgi:hypothetical protein
MELRQKANSPREQSDRRGIGTNQNPDIASLIQASLAVHHLRLLVAKVIRSLRTHFSSTAFFVAKAGALNQAGNV